MGRPTVVVMVTVVAALSGLVLAACATAFGEMSDDPDPTEVSMTLRDDQERATTALVDAFSSLQAIGLQPSFASFDYSTCDRAEPAWRADAYGRLDHPDRRFSVEADAVGARDALVELGWTPRDSSRWTDGIWASASRWHLAADRGEMAIILALYTEQPYVLVTVLGPCVEVPEGEEDRYGLDFVPVDLDELVGGTGRSGDSTVPLTTE